MPKAKTQFSSETEITPIFMPQASMTDVIDHTVWIKEIHVANKHTGDVTVTVQDKQGTPIPILSSSILGAGDAVHGKYDGLKMVGGFSWQASVADVIAVRCRYAE